MHHNIAPVGSFPATRKRRQNRGPGGTVSDSVKCGDDLPGMQPTAAAETFDWLVCPECGDGLAEHTQALACRSCDRRWPILGGVPHFVSDFPYWGEIAQPEMQEVNRR